MTSTVAGPDRRLQPARRTALVIVLGALLLGVLAAIHAATHMAVNTDTTDMIAADVPFREHDIAFRRAFPREADQLVVLVEGGDAGLAQAGAQRLVAALAADPAHFQGVLWPEGDPFFRRNGLLYLPPDELGAMSSRLAEAQPFLAALAAEPTLPGLLGLLRQGLAAGPEEARRLGPALRALTAVAEAQVAGRPGDLSWRDLVGGEAGGPARQLVLVGPVLDYGAMLPGAAALGALARITDDLAAPGLAFRVTGGPALDQEELESVGQGTGAASLGSLAAVAGLLVLGLGSWQLILATLASLVLGLVLTTALGLMAVGALNLISVTFAVLFIGIGIDFGIHLALRYREGLGRGLAQPAALAWARRSVARGLALTALCAAIGFLAFVPTSYRGLAELGIISAIGMGVALLTTLTFLPALLALLPPPRSAGPTLAAPAPQREAVLDRLLRRGRRPLLALALLIAAAGACALPWLRFDFNPLHLKDPNGPAVRAFAELAADPATTPYVIDVLAPDLPAAEVLAARLRQVPGVAEALTLADLVPVDQEAKLAAIDELALLLGPALTPRSATSDAAARAAAVAALRAGLGRSEDADARGLDAALAALGTEPAALRELERRLTSGLPALLDDLATALQAAPVQLADLPTGLRAQWQAVDGQARIMVRPAGGIAGNEDLARFADAVLAVAPAATGAPVIITEAGRTVLRAFAEATGGALLGIALTLLLVLRRPSDVLRALAPLAVAAAGVVLTCVAAGLGFNFANLIALPLLLGLGVSSAINLLVRFRLDGRERGLFATSTPRAVLFSAFTTLASCVSLALARHPGMASMGLLLTIAIGWSLVASLAVLPALLGLGGADEDA